MVTYTIEERKVKQVVCFVSEKELQLIKRKANLENRSISNLVYSNLRKTGLLPNELENAENYRIKNQMGVSQ